MEAQTVTNVKENSDVRMQATETRWLVNVTGKPTTVFGDAFVPAKKGEEPKSKLELSFKDLVCGSLLGMTYSAWKEVGTYWCEPKEVYDLYKKVVKAEQPVWLSRKEVATIQALAFVRHGLEVTGALVDYMESGEKKEFPLE